jgi:alpha/beta superfamily hydrolase
LPAPEREHQVSGAYVAPQSELEQQLAAVWREVLKVERVGVHDNFFDIGGHSLLAIESIVKFKQRTGQLLDPNHFYQQTLGQLAASVGDGNGAPGDREARAATLDLDPFYFGPDGRRLYGLIRAAPGPRTVGVVLCQPHAHEYVRCHRAFRELGQRLAWAGLPVLSFDYYGTGDSGGEYAEGTIDGWVGDTGLAIDTLKEKTGVARICLIGLRLGAALAVMTGAGRNDLAGMALWDPIVAGADIAAEMQAIRELQALDPARQRDIATPDVLCYPLTPGVSSKLERLDLCALSSISLPRLLVLETEREGSGRRFADGAAARGSRVDYQCIDEAKVWLREPYEAIVPRKCMEALASWTSRLLS